MAKKYETVTFSGILKIFLNLVSDLESKLLEQEPHRYSPESVPPKLLGYFRSSGSATNLFLAITKEIFKKINCFYWQLGNIGFHLFDILFMIDLIQKKYSYYLT
jgi:hypothetical protein